MRLMSLFQISHPNSHWTDFIDIHCFYSTKELGLDLELTFEKKLDRLGDFLRRALHFLHCILSMIITLQLNSPPSLFLTLVFTVYSRPALTNTHVGQSQRSAD